MGEDSRAEASSGLLLRFLRAACSPQCWWVPGLAPRVPRRSRTCSTLPSAGRSAVAPAAERCMWKVDRTQPCFGGCIGSAREGCGAARALVGARRRPSWVCFLCTGRRLACCWSPQMGRVASVRAAHGRQPQRQDSGLCYYSARACALHSRTCACVPYWSLLCAALLVCPADASIGSSCLHMSNPRHRELGMVSGGRGLVRGSVGTGRGAAGPPECASLHG